LPLLDDVHRHRLRRVASHLPARRSRQNANLFLREPLALPEKPGLGIELNPDVVNAHLAKGETYWD
jgi:L-alanine-DL-glutamate epimerase-like enolase superfamily enzyme